MNIFHSLLQKLGIEKPATASGINASAGAQVATPRTTSTPGTPNPSSVASSNPASGVGAAVGHSSSAPAHSAPASMVDVTSKLDNLARTHPGLDWRVSIADLLQLLDMDNSYTARKELATELGCPENLMRDSASMNVWLHKMVLQKIAENGGNVPETLVHA